jgi:protein phosphatase
MKLTSHIGFSEKGKRDNNEDFILTTGESETSNYDITVVCDGVGGNQKGEIASELACAEFLDYLGEQITINETVLKDAVRFVESKLNAYVDTNPYSDGMATTLTLAILENEVVHFMHIGDSKILGIQKGQLAYESQDHSLVNEMVETGLISEEEALVHPKRNVITRALAAGTTIAEPTLKSVDGWLEGDAIFLCTDGVLESFTTDELFNLIISDKGDQEIIDHIKSMCLIHSKDNYSGYLLRF